jgi:hypothetical protein
MRPQSGILGSGKTADYIKTNLLIGILAFRETWARAVLTIKLLISLSALIRLQFVTSRRAHFADHWRGCPETKTGCRSGRSNAQFSASALIGAV